MQEEKYDVVIIGGGPAGGQAARNLSQKGYKTLLVERYKSFNDNNFSSAGMTLEPLDEFNLPDNIIGSYWKDITIQCTKKGYDWFGEKPKGVVLDFGKLRQFLADESVSSGGEVLMGHKYVQKRVQNSEVEVDLIDQETAVIKTIKTRLVIDATGPLRKVMYDSKEEQPKMDVGSGTEYLIEVDQVTYDKYKERLVFFLGHKWTLKGYSWIFPMENRILKVGSGRTHLKSKNQENTDKSTKKITEKIIKEYIQPQEYTLIDVHGGILRYCEGLNDTYYKNGVIAIGDAISAVNPRGGEGIRYAMQSADLASDYIDSYFKTGKENFKEYEKKWKQKKLLKWRLSEASSKRMYSKYSDEQIENRVDFFQQNFSMDVLVDSLFNFKYNKMVFRIFSFLWLKLKYKFKKEEF
ncbi:NAD(P)/FAD-dependent oxidoreductase [Polaribacter sp. ALD11]|uniref:NAD(P)/FAD-dependent oxidoreductase n=1 Tax=Polaribacter sp. ALD11 TaxID=2058137 RepID=UPI000C3191F0|nr:NAD(P)/FAD-dependent oxidoreductase [Polaribacter sp. ALD11]AUC85899.1 NAD(P)/FAD-dependent oxidoreductase [Polaribacter sp. ALD11]